MTASAQRSAARVPASDARYRPLEDYALIGNTHTAALVSTGGSIDWCCLPHFDSPAVFLRLLDAERGGYFEVAPVGRFAARRVYAGDSAVLVTTFETDRGRVRVTDFMHAQDIARSRLGVDDAHCHRVLRLVEGVEGEVDIVMRFRPTPDYARERATLDIAARRVVGQTSRARFLLELPPVATIESDSGGDVRASARLRGGERAWFVLSFMEGAALGEDLACSNPDDLLSETRASWANWSSQCTYEGPYHELVRVSARVLKLLTFAPTGALVAAPTTSLPEELGGVRNWDYRFAWLRDSALILHALQSIGYHAAARDFFRWLEATVPVRQPPDLRIMYTIRGESELPEDVLQHLEGYRRSAPVRIGNAAAEQAQLDVYGYVLDAAWLCWREGRPIRPQLWEVLRHLADQAAAGWRNPDQGMWEVRGAPRHFLSSKLMCWVAVDRAMKLARDGGLGGDVAVWSREREALRAAILQHGFDETVGAFTQAFGERELDASALLLPLVGFMPASDPRARSTADRIAQQLSSNGLVYRYRALDGLPGGEATFAICTFWLAENLVLQGRTDEGRRLFESVTRFANDVGLLAEEIDPIAGHLLGNYPQGFTHLALIQCALRIAEAEGGNGRRNGEAGR